MRTQAERDRRTLFLHFESNESLSGCSMFQQVHAKPRLRRIERMNLD